MTAHDMTGHDMTGHDEDGYTGPATLTVHEHTFTVTVELRGHFQPIDGYYHWYGRITTHQELSALLGGRKAEAVLATPDGEATGQLTDPDPWGRYRIAGTSTPPFHVPATLADIESTSTG